MGDYYYCGCCVCCLSKNKKNAIAKNKEIDLSFIEQRKRERREIKLLVIDQWQIYAQQFQNQDSHQITELLSFVEPIRHLWADEGFKNCFKLCKDNHRHLTSLEYFVDRLEQITANNYIPITADIFRTHSPTNGIAELTIPMNSVTFRFFNVSGQRGQRKKWIHHFENVTTVIFVASLSEYDEFLEENNKNRMEESLPLFNSVTHSPWFAQSFILLLLNKKDILARKIQFSHLKTFFPEFEGNIQNTDDAMKFMLKSYERNATPDPWIYSQFICVKDFTDTRIIFECVKDSIVRQTIAQFELS
nr:guanine nucleotide-binding protein G(q) subunit alpha isoform X1 [Danio rerio]|eukprot:XP_003201106.1 guanine nucleotide-binding protein G(q) subunit alpha isoform X1 [Danio rerio]